jgi:hypothetical protein
LPCAVLVFRVHNVHTRYNFKISITFNHCEFRVTVVSLGTTCLELMWPSISVAVKNSHVGRRQTSLARILLLSLVGEILNLCSRVAPPPPNDGDMAQIANKP